MPVLAIFSGPITKTQYEILRSEIDWEKQQPQGAVFHVASFDESGHAHVADVWESQESLNAFVTGRLLPTMQRHQMAQPNVSVFPTHVVQAYKAIERYRI